MLTKLALVLGAFAGAVHAAPSTRAIKDAPFSTPLATMQAAITCPNGIKNKAGGIVFLVHGTGSAGAESWAAGPYVKVLPTAGKGYDVCWVDLPGRSVVDVQLSAEYVAYGVQYLAPKSSTKKVSIIGHSQGGGVNPQWALTFWPSIRPLVTNYIALAPDFHGTVVGLLACNPLMLGTCAPSLWQQTSGSNYLAAQNSLLAGGGGRALVPTTSIYTITDQIVQPQLINPSSALPGATLFPLQSLNVCGPAHFADHFTIIVNPAAFGLAKATLENGGPIKASQFDKTYCTYLKDNVLLDPSGTPPLLQSLLANVATFATAANTPAEPSLQPYVCERGFATNCGPAF